MGILCQEREKGWKASDTINSWERECVSLYVNRGLQKKRMANDFGEIKLHNCLAAGRQMHPIADYYILNTRLIWETIRRAGIVTFIRTGFEFVFRSQCWEIKWWCGLTFWHALNIVSGSTWMSRSSKSEDDIPSYYSGKVNANHLQHSTKRLQSWLPTAHLLVHWISQLQGCVSRHSTQHDLWSCYGLQCKVLSVFMFIIYNKIILAPLLLTANYKSWYILLIFLWTV